MHVSVYALFPGKFGELEERAGPAEIEREWVPRFGAGGRGRIHQPVRHRLDAEIQHTLETGGVAGSAVPGVGTDVRGPDGRRHLGVRPYPVQYEAPDPRAARNHTGLRGQLGGESLPVPEHPVNHEPVQGSLVARMDRCAPDRAEVGRVLAPVVEDDPVGSVWVVEGELMGDVVTSPTRRVLVDPAEEQTLRQLVELSVERQLGE